MYVMGVYSDLTKLCCFERSHISTALPRSAWLCALIEVCLQTLFQRERVEDSCGTHIEAIPSTVSWYLAAILENNV